MEPQAPGAYWNPLPLAHTIAAGWGSRSSIGVADWADRSWLTPPGPFYTGITDDGLNGPVHAPEVILTGNDGYEIIYRQPRTPAEVAALMVAAWGEPMGGYGWDGDDRWTVVAVRDWWSGRARVREWIDTEIIRRSADAHDHVRDQVPALVRFAADIDGPLERYLRGYLYWLSERTEPAPGAALPLV